MAFLAFCLLAVAGTSAHSEDPIEAPGGVLPQAQSSAGPRTAVERGLTFLQSDATTWRQEHKCVTCHHGTMTVWVLTEAKRQGYGIAPDVLAETVSWTKEKLAKIDEPRDQRPGFNMMNTPAVYLSLLALTEPGQDAVSVDELKRISAHLVRHQEADGSWAYSLAPAANRYPPVFESDEVATLLASLALGVPAAADQPSAARDSRERAAGWLRSTESTDTTQAAALRLLVTAKSGSSAEILQSEIDRFLSRQNEDGGWSQRKDLPSDAYATGQALYVLDEVGVQPDHTAIRSAVAFLLTTQKENGSWPMTPRAQPGEKPATNALPITYFGSAWATLGLLRSVSK